MWRACATSSLPFDIGHRGKLSYIFQVQVYLQQNKKKAEAEGKNCHAKNCVEFGKADKAYMKDTPHVPLRQIDEE
jgi:hypothetical protein